MNGKIVRGRKSTFKKETRGMGEYFFDAAIKHGDKICQIDSTTGESESFASVKDRSTLAAIHMSKLGIHPEDVIVCCLRNNLNTIIPVLASLYLGAKVASVDPTLSVAECLHCISLVQPRCIFVEEDSVKLIEDSLLEANFKADVIVIGDTSKYKKFSDLQTHSPEEEKFTPLVVPDCHDTAFICFSSGTTGLPKGICLTHFGLLNSCISSIDLNSLSLIEQHVFITFSSLYWVSAITTLTASFTISASRVLTSKFEAENVLQLIETYKVTIIPIIHPTYTYHLTSLDNVENYDISSLMAVVISGGTISSEQSLKTRQFFKTAFVAITYGCTEAPGAVTSFNFNKDKHLLNKTGSCGKCVTDMEIKVVDIDTRELLGPNQTGEVCIKSPYVMKGYYKMDSSTVYDEEGFIKTGDLGYYDDDECFYVVDRIKDIFKCGPWQVVPAFLESLLQEHPAVREAVVFGIPHKIDEFHPAACVKLKENVKVSAEEIKQFLAGKTSEWNTLRGGIKIVKFIPKTSSGKILRRKMRDIFLMD